MKKFTGLKWGIVWMCLFGVFMFPKTVSAEPGSRYIEEAYDDDCYFYDPNRLETPKEAQAPRPTYAAPNLQPTTSQDDLETDFDWHHTLFGEEVSVPDGVVYYASADLSGSGPRNCTGEENIYTAGKHFYIGGFAVVGEDDRLLSYECYLGNQITPGQFAPPFCSEPETGAAIWIHLYTETTDDGSLGWILASQAQPVDCRDNSDPSESVTVSDIAETVEELSREGTVALLLDASGSVSDYSAEIASYATQVDRAEEIIIFADLAKQISASNYNDEQYNVGGGTDIYGALNSLSAETVFDEVIIVTDTHHNKIDSVLIPRDNIKQLTIVSIAPPDFVQSSVLSTIQTQWGIEPRIKYLLHS